LKDSGSISGSISGMSINHAKRELDALILHDGAMTANEQRVLEIAKDELRPYDSDSMSNFSRDSGFPISASSEKYKAERTSLLHGNIQYDKYPESTLEAIGKELDEDKDLTQVFGAPYDHREGVRKRSLQEINAEKARLTGSQMTENQKMMREQTQLLDGLNDLNMQVTEATEQIYEQRETQKHSLTFTDLKREREVLKKANDYSEKAAELPSEADDGVAKKKKRKNKKNKKKKQQEEEKPQELNMDWQKDLTSTLQKEKRDEQESRSDGSADKYFDDDYLRNELKPTLNQSDRGSDREVSPDSI
jgi:hypothetical protein